MKTSISVFDSNQVNRYGYMTPAEALANAYIEQRNGFPQCIGHDMHRPIGWAHLLGLNFEKGICTLIGTTSIAENAKELDEISLRHQGHLDRSYYEKTIASAEAFTESLKGKLADGLKMSHSGCPIIIQDKIAQEIFPKLYDLQDDDGLIYISDILNEFKYLGSGAFGHKTQSYVIFAHRFLRKQLSLHNSLRSIFIDKLVANFQNINYKTKLRLDPDVIGWKPEFHQTLELEYWYGPKFDDNILAIQTGVARYEASESERNFEQISRTEFYWYVSEDAHNFECEEILDSPSVGLGSDRYGCRYIHTIFNHKSETINHFDGAIREYTEDQFLTRLDQSFDKAGKNTKYTKLFRIDGAISVSEWKNSSVLYMQGNSQISEYFGVKQFPEPSENTTSEATDHQKISTRLYTGQDGLRIFVSASVARRSQLEFCDFSTLNFDGIQYRIIDADSIDIMKRLKRVIPEISVPDNIFRTDISDVYLNVPTLHVPSLGERQSAIREITKIYSECILAFSKAFSHKYGAISISWPLEEKTAKISIMGSFAEITDALRQISYFPEKADQFQSFISSLNAQFNPGDEIVTPRLNRLCLIANNATLRFNRIPVHGQYLKFETIDNEQRIFLTDLANDVIGETDITIANGVLLKSSTCSICGNEYIKCSHNKIDNECNESPKDFSIFGLFWTRKN